MTLISQTQRWPYLGDGITVRFDFDARVDLASDMSVFINGAVTTIGYTVVGLGVDTGGYVEFNTPPADGDSISLERILPFQQTTDYPVRGPFPAKDHEGTLDRIVMMLQQERTALIDLYNYLGIGSGGGVIYPIGGQVPVGLIAQWAGSVANIPSGWFLCDGNNGTPDLSAKFTVCIDEDGTEFNVIGGVGGETEHTLTLGEMPNHQHNVEPTGIQGVAPDAGSSDTAGGSQLKTPIQSGEVTGHPLSIGQAQPHNNLPPYYTLAYIQYQGGDAAPTFIGSFPSQMFSEGEIVNIDVSTEFSVGDGTNPVYSAIGLPAGVTIDAVTGVISGTVAVGAGDLSPYDVQVTLTTSINPPATSFPVSVWTIAGGGPSALVTWLEGAGAPIINGPEYTSLVADAAVNDPVASTINTIDSDTGLYYAEFELITFGTNVGFGFGWHRVDTINFPGSAQTVGVYWDQVASNFRVNRETLGSNAFSFENDPAAPLNGMVFGVALDCSTNKIFIQINGVWMTSNGGAAGGAPSGGIGWDILNPAQEMILYSYSQSDNCTLQARDPQYTPAGFTPVT